MVSFFGLSVPVFGYHLMLIMLCSVWLQWLPTGGMFTIDSPFSLADGRQYLVLPTLVLGTAAMAEIVRDTRASMLTALRQDYFKTARSKGISEVKVLTPFISPLLAPYNPQQIDLLRRFVPICVEPPLGTDENGRDMLSSLMYGGRVSLGVGCVSVLAAIIAIGLTSWMAVARVVRGEVLGCRGLEYIEAAHAVGAPHSRILCRHILPQALPAVIVAATLGVAYAILTESALSYLGLGVRPPTPSWGNMLSSARSYLWTAPHLAIFPGLLILLTVLAYNSLGDGLRDALSS